MFGMSNDRRIMCGETGRGGLPGKASAGLVYASEKPASVAQSSPSVALHAQISNWRSAVKRF